VVAGDAVGGPAVRQAEPLLRNADFMRLWIGFFSMAERASLPQLVPDSQRTGGFHIAVTRRKHNDNERQAAWAA
jgi:hypothetical protein